MSDTNADQGNAEIPKGEAGAIREETPQVNPIVKMLQRQDEISVEMNALAGMLEDKGLSGQVYPPDAVIQVPGEWMAGVSNFISAISKNVGVIQHSLQQMNSICEGIVTTGSEYQLEIMKMHIANCESGVTISKVQAEKTQAEDGTEVIKPKVKKVVKTTKKAAPKAKKTPVKK